MIWSKFLPTPSARRATPGLRSWKLHADISTHALREEGDQIFAVETGAILRISTHALREEGDLIFVYPDPFTVLFLPTPSARRATGDVGPLIWLTKNFYPRPPRGGRRGLPTRHLP